MARRRSAAQKAAFRKMIAGLRASRARRGPRRGGVVVLANPKRRSKRRRSRSVVVMANPRRRRRRAFGRNVAMRRGRRRRRNPGGAVMGTVTGLFKIGVPAILAGGSFGLIDSRLLATASTPVRYAVKAAYALALGVLFRRNPTMSAATMGGVLGSFGSDLAAKLGGGTPAAPTAAAAAAGIGVLLREDRAAMGLLVQEMGRMGLAIGPVDNNGLGRLGTTGVGDDGGVQNFSDVNLG
jgi:hypothetical protein